MSGCAAPQRVRPVSKRSNNELLVVDGYNVIYGTPRYQRLIDEGSGKRRDHDPFDRAREALVGDVAAFAQGRYEPVIVFDAAGNLNPEHPELRRAGVRMIFSPTGVSADTVIEKLVTECRQKMREVTVVTSDNTIRATVGGIPVTYISSSLLAHEIEVLDVERVVEASERSYSKLTVKDRLDPKTLAKLNALLGR